MRGAIVAAAAAVGLLLSGQALKAQEGEIFNVAQATNPCLLADRKGQLQAIFEGFSEGAEQREIFSSSSGDAGRTWTHPQNVSQTAGVSSQPCAAIETSGAIDVAWRDSTSGELSPDIYFARSTDGGQTWSKALDISNTPGVCSVPAIATGPDNSIHVIWIDTSRENRPDVFYTASIDGGKTWSKYDDISPTPGISEEPTIAVAEDGTVHAAWADTSSGEEHPDIYYVKKSGSSWTLPLDVSKSKLISSHPGLGCGPKGKVYMCWSDNSRREHASDIWLAIAGKSGMFAKPLNMSDTPGISSQPVITANSAGLLAIAWVDTSSGSSRPDIYARVSTDGGSDYSNIMDITNTRGVSQHPAVALVGTKMIVMWEEVVGSISTVKTTSVELKGIATGPADQVDPTIHKGNR